MIIWGGDTDPGGLNTGGIYSPATDAWTPTSLTNAPTARYGHTMVWVPSWSWMIVWGGRDSSLSYTNTGGVYGPQANWWTPMSTTNAPTPRTGHTAVWTGSRMIVWGGSCDSCGPIETLVSTGGIYDPGTHGWTPTSTTNAPTPRAGHTAVWTGSKMIIWGGGDDSPAPMTNTGGIYDPATDTWTPTSTTNAPTGAAGHTAVWTGSKMIVWGGWDLAPDWVNTGGSYDPETDTWTPTSTTNAPTPRTGHTAVWTGSKMIVWGGYGGSYVDTGGIYDPATDSWVSTNTTGPPTGRSQHTGVWTGSKMIVWGGYDGGFTDTGANYFDPAVLPPGTDFYTVTPCRVFDTRMPSGPTLGRALSCRAPEQSFAVAGKCLVPSSAKGVSVNLTGTGSTAQGNIRLFAAGDPAPLVSTLNYVAGQTRANNAVVALGTDGRISVLCSSGTTHVVLDVNGYFQ